MQEHAHVKATKKDCQAYLKVILGRTRFEDLSSMLSSDGESERWS